MPTASSRRRDLYQLFLLAGVGGVVFLLFLGRLPLIEPDEGRNAEVAREMLTTGDFVTPHFNTLVYLDKPVVYFWMVAGAMRLAGANEWAARLPSALMAFATMFLTWFFARRFLGKGASLRAGLVFATAPLAIVYARLVIFDMTLAFLVTVAMVSFWRAQESGFRRPLFDLIFFAAMGVAAITKGPVGFLLPLLSILAFQVLTGRFRELKNLRWGMGLLVFLAAALPWFILVSMRNPDFPRYAFWEESLLRFATSTTRRGGSLFYYMPIFLGGLFPWSLFLLFAGLRKIRQRRSVFEARHRGILYLLTWAAVVFVFFTVSRSKLPGYFLPALVPLSILTAAIWKEIESQDDARPGWLRAGFLTMAGLGVAIAALPQVLRLESVWVAATEKNPPGILDLMQNATFHSGVVLVALAIFGRNLAKRRAGRKLALASFVLLALTVPLLLVRWSTTLYAYAQATSSRRLAQAILASPEKDLPIYGYYCFRTGLPFSLRRPVGLVTADASEMTSNYVSANLARMRRAQHARAMGQAGAAPVLLDATDLRSRALHGASPFLVLVRNRDARKLSQTVPEMEPLWNDWEYSIWKIPAGASGAAGYSGQDAREKP